LIQHKLEMAQARAVKRFVLIQHKLETARARNGAGRAAAGR
jgi:hypothetical protein